MRFFSFKYTQYVNLDAMESQKKIFFKLVIFKKI